jgi:hypothetical protein
MHEHRIFDDAIDDYIVFNRGAYSHAEHVAHVSAIMAHGKVLLRALGAPPMTWNTQPELVALCTGPMLWSLEYFAHMDRANAAVHCATVKYSPITFRLANTLYELSMDNALISEVRSHQGAYEEDTGR